MRKATDPTAVAVQAQLLGKAEVLEFEIPTRSAAEAAAAIGCKQDQIAKSILFMGKETAKAYAAIMAGDQRACPARLATLSGEALRLAKPAEVEGHTGYIIGGVSPVGLNGRGVTIFLDQHLASKPEIWAAAGTPHSVFCLTPAFLRQLTGNADFHDIAHQV